MDPTGLHLSPHQWSPLGPNWQHSSRAGGRMPHRPQHWRLVHWDGGGYASILNLHSLDPCTAYAACASPQATARASTSSLPQPLLQLRVSLCSQRGCSDTCQACMLRPPRILSNVSTGVTAWESAPPLRISAATHQMTSRCSPSSSCPCYACRTSVRVTAALQPPQFTDDWA